MVRTVASLKRLAALVVGGLLGACAPEPIPPRSPEPAPLTPGPYRPPPLCRRHDDCLARGLQAREENPLEARALLKLACDKGSPLGCLELGKALLGEGPNQDPRAADEILGELCHTRAPLGDPRWAFQPTGIELERCRADACAWRVAGRSASDDEPPQPADPERLADASMGCALDGATEPKEAVQDSARMRLRACRIVATRGDDAGRQALSRACALGDGPACEEVARAPAPPPASSSGASLTMPSLETDGLRLREVRCELANSSVVGLLTGMTVGAGFAQRKGALERCVSGPTEVQIRWRAADLVVKELTARATDPKVATCVQNVLRGSLTAMAGSCEATLLLGAIAP